MKTNEKLTTTTIYKNVVKQFVPVALLLKNKYEHLYQFIFSIKTTSCNQYSHTNAFNGSDDGVRLPMLMK